MGERIINPLFNVQDKYKEMHIINPYRFGGATLKEGLVSVWELDETSGTTAYDSHGSNDGTITGATINQTGKIDKAYSFDGSVDYVQINSNFFTDVSVFTISLWFNSSSTFTQEGSIFNKYGTTTSNYIGLHMLYPSPNKGKIRFYVRDGSNNYAQIITPLTYDDDQWYHIVAIKDGNDLYLYIDNIYINTTNTSFSSFSFGTNHPLRLGVNSNYTNGAAHKGLIDQTAYWIKALNVSERSTLYNSGNGLAYSSW